MNTATLMRVVVLSAGLASLAACGKKDADDAAPIPPISTTTAPALTVADVSMGKSVGADKRVTVMAESFAPGDTIYASVRTTGAAPTATLAARWTFQDGQVVDERTETIAPTGETYTEFHIMKPGGWPKGKYTLHVLLNGTEVQTKEVEVK